MNEADFRRITEQVRQFLKHPSPEQSSKSRSEPSEHGPFDVWRAGDFDHLLKQVASDRSTLQTSDVELLTLGHIIISLVYPSIDTAPDSHSLQKILPEILSISTFLSQTHPNSIRDKPLDCLIAFLNGWSGNASIMRPAELRTCARLATDDLIQRWVSDSLDWLQRPASSPAKKWSDLKFHEIEPDHNAPPLVPGITKSLDAKALAESISNSLLAKSFSCECWIRPLLHRDDSYQPELLQKEINRIRAEIETETLESGDSGPARKYQNCSRNHTIQGWHPEKESLAAFIERAVTGATSHMRYQAKAFGSGMLMYMLFLEPSVGLRLGKIAYWSCQYSGHETYLPACPRCASHIFEPSVDRRFAKDDLFVAERAGYFKLTSFSVCRNSGCLPSDRPISERNIYHGDACPLCISVAQGKQIGAFQLIRDVSGVMLEPTDQIEDFPFSESSSIVKRLLLQASPFPDLQRETLRLLAIDLTQTGTDAEVRGFERHNLFWLIGAKRAEENWIDLVTKLKSILPPTEENQRTLEQLSQGTTPEAVKERSELRQVITDIVQDALAEIDEASRQPARASATHNRTD